MELEQRDFRPDPLKIKRLRISASLTKKEFEKVSGLSKETTTKILRGQPVLLNSLSQAVSEAFGIDDPLEVLHPDELAALGVTTDVTQAGQVLEWEIDEYLTGWNKTTNGLHYQLAKLKHRFLNGRLVRGKCYELRHMTSEQKDEVEGHLSRHADVSEEIGSHPNIAQNITAALVDGLWWVMDRWEEGDLLSQRISNGALGEYHLKFIMTGIAEGLFAMHKSDIVRRELTPDSVILRESDDRPVLTDMELAKLTKGGPTVAPSEWPEDPYRAPEVDGSAPIDQTADIYSWGRIFVHAAVGSLPERGDEVLPADTFVPDAVRDLVTQAVDVFPDDRPKSFEPIIKALKDWP